MTWRWDGEKVVCGVCGSKALVSHGHYPTFDGPEVTLVNCHPCRRLERLPGNHFNGWSSPQPQPMTPEEKRAYAREHGIPLPEDRRDDMSPP
jgi:hypothetical protein